MKLTVQLGSGRNFPSHGEGLACVATFGGQTQQSAPAVGSGAHPAWHAAFVWELEPRELRSLEASGALCKLDFVRADGRKVGWLVLDLRAAKLNARRAGYAGSWFAVSGPFRGSGATPEVHVLHVLAENPAASMDEPAGSSRTDSASNVQGSMWSGRAAGSGSGAAAAALPAGQAPLQHGAREDGPKAAALAALSKGLVQDRAPRRFRFSLDLRSFSAGRRLPLNLAAVVVQLSLPPEFAALVAQGAGGRLPPRLACLRTHPAVEVPRGSEVALPRGLAGCDFSAGLLTLATLLAR